MYKAIFRYFLNNNIKLTQKKAAYSLSNFRLILGIVERTSRYQQKLGAARFV